MYLPALVIVPPSAPSSTCQVIEVSGAPETVTANVNELPMANVAVRGEIASAEPEVSGSVSQTTGACVLPQDATRPPCRAATTIIRLTTTAANVRIGLRPPSRIHLRQG